MRGAEYKPDPKEAVSADGPQHFLVGLGGGFMLGILTAVSLGWWPL
jgi:hypothetical protein